MAIKLFFGLPGCGKTTLMAYFANKYLNKRNSPYDNVYVNIPMSIPGVIQIDNDHIGKYDLRNGLLLIDEATLFADSRDYKNFDKDRIKFFLLHRHYKLDIYLFTQQWDAVDRKIRVITDRVYYVYKGLIFGRWFTNFYRIPYGIIIPDPNKKGASGEKLGEIIQGYAKPPLLVRLFSSKIYRPRYYRYFDSWEAPTLLPLPDEFRYPGIVESKQKVIDFRIKVSDLLCKLSDKINVDPSSSV